MGNTLTTYPTIKSYTSVFTQCIRTTRRRNIKRTTSQQLININHVPNDGFLYDDDSDEDDDGLCPQDEKVIFYKPKK